MVSIVSYQLCCALVLPIGPRMVEWRLLIFKTPCSYANGPLWEVFHNFVQILNEALKPRRLKNHWIEANKSQSYFVKTQGCFLHLTTSLSPFKSFAVLGAGMLVLRVVNLSSIGCKMPLSFLQTPWGIPLFTVTLFIFPKASQNF